MASKPWNIAAAKAELSQVVRRAKHAPQILENRGTPVAVVVAIEDFRRLANGEDKRQKWLDFLALSAELRADGDPGLEVPARTTRPDPFAPSRRKRR